MFDHDIDFASDDTETSTIEDLFRGDDAAEAWEWATETESDLRL